MIREVVENRWSRDLSVDRVVVYRVLLGFHRIDAVVGSGRLCPASHALIGSMFRWPNSPSGGAPARFPAGGVVGFELMVLAYLRWRFFGDTFVRALGIVTFAGIVIAALSAGLGSLLGNPGAG